MSSSSSDTGFTSAVHSTISSEDMVDNVTSFKRPTVNMALLRTWSISKYFSLNRALHFFCKLAAAVMAAKCLPGTLDGRLELSRRSSNQLV